MKRFVTAILAAAALCALVGCANAPTIDPVKARAAAQTAVKATRVGYNIAVIAARAYAALPPCASLVGASTGVCSNAGIVSQIAAAEAIAGPALADAERIINDPNATADASSLAIATLESAFKTFTEVTTNLPALSGEGAPTVPAVVAAPPPAK